MAEQVFLHHLLAVIVGLDRAIQILPQMSAPTPRCVMYHKTPSDDTNNSEEISVAPPLNQFTVDNHNISNRDSQVTENVRPSCQFQASHQNEGATTVEPTVTAGTSQHGRVCTMSGRMTKSVAQGLHHMAHQSTKQDR